MVSKKETIISLIENGVFSTPLPMDFPKELSAPEAEMLLRVSKLQDLAHIVASALTGNGISIPSKVEAEFQKQLFISVYRAEKLQYELNRLSSIFEEAAIPFIPLKGSVLRPFYPESWMRTSCDIDLLVKEEDLERACEVTTKKAGYGVHGQWKGERSFFTPDGIHLELHFYDADDTESGLVFRQIWDHVSPAEGFQFRMETEWEYFYLHHVAHMAKHFSHGGCGIRPFLDLALMRKKIPMSSETKLSYLKKYDLVPFAEAAEHLAAVWFGEEGHTPLTERMEEYLLGAGIFGSIENQVALEKSGKSKLLSGFFSHIWLPYDAIKHQYPILLSHKILLPFCQVRRWFKLVFCGGWKRSMYHLRQNRKISDEKVKKVAELMDDLQLS